MRRLLLTLTCLLALTGAGGALAWAHSDLVSVTPSDGATLATAPTAVTLVFNEDVQADFTAVVVEGPGGSGVAGEPTSSGPTVTQALRDDLDPGDYTIRYKVVSADGHPISGTSTFTIDAAATTSNPTPTAPSPVPASTTATATAAGSEQRAGTAVWVVVGLAALLVVIGAAAKNARRRPQP